MHRIRKLVTVECPNGHSYESSREDWQKPAAEPCGVCFSAWMVANIPAAAPTGVWRDEPMWGSLLADGSA